MGNFIAKWEEGLAGQKDNLLLWFPVFFGFGSAMYFGLKSELGQSTVVTFWILSLAVLVFVFYLRARLNFIWFFASLAIFLSLTGFALAQIRTYSVYTPILLKETRPVIVEGNVSHTETLEGRKGMLLILDHVSIENFTPDKTPYSLRLTSRLHTNFNLGDRIQVLAKLTPPSMPVMPEAYDFRRHYFFDSVGGMGFILKPPTVIAPAQISQTGLFLENLRQKMADHIKSVLPSRLSGIVIALVTGERAAIDDDDWQALRISGLAHVISISGLHVVLIATPIFFVVRFFLALIPGLALRLPIKKIAAFIALIGCSLYVGLVVPTVPTYRALLMTGIGLIAIMLDRSPFSLRLISFAALIVLIIAPESIWSASFQLSFAAVLSLILSAEWTREYWSRWNGQPGRTRKFLLYLGGSIFTTLVVSVITAPLAAYHFQQIPVYSVVANALLIPLSAIIIMPGTIFTFLLWPFGLQDIPLKIMGFGVEWMLAIAQGTAEWPGAVLRLSAWPFSSLVCFVIAGLSLYLLQGRGKWLFLPLLVTGTIFIFIATEPEILVSQSGRLLLLKDKQNIYLSSDRGDRFFAESWLKRLGKLKEAVLILPDEGQIDLSDGEIICGEDVCRIIKGDKKISFGNDYYALRQDCAWADIIITQSAFRDRACKAKIMNKFTLSDTGAVEITDHGEILSTVESLGIRPWSPKPQRFNDRSASTLTARPESAPGRP